MGLMGERKEDEHGSVNFLQVTHDKNLDDCLLNGNSPTKEIS